ncbi:MAG: efflux RND transporter permease subunit [Phycisphaerales bacterium JB037]
MNPIRWCISRPVSVSVGVLLVVMFGVLGLREIPVQLTPTVDRPVVTVTTNWAGRSPQEIVDEITKEQEEQLKNVDNLKSMRSTSRTGQAEITLEFYIGTDIDAARQDVSDRLRQVPEYPEDVDEPVVEAAEGGVDQAIAWLIIDVDPSKVPPELRNFDVSTLADDVEDEIKPFLERIDGVARVNVFGGRQRELQVLLDPERLAARQLSYQEVIDALRRENENISAGTINEGKRSVRVRVIGQFQTEDQVLETIIAYRDGRPVFVKDIGAVDLDFEKQRGFVRALGQRSIAMPVIRQTGANVMEIMTELRARLDEIRADILPTLDPQVGAALRLRQVYDETIYIDSAIDLVTQNIVVGGLIAAGVLIIFLRSFVTTGVIALAIPISVIATFLVMFVSGRTLNVISLAGLAFAVGMVVDNAIVVLENIYRRLQEGDPPRTAAYEGAREVWGAVLASTLTTVAVFIPVLTIQEEAGQLFRDISLAIVAAVSLSLIVSVMVIPTACAAWLRVRPARGGVIGRVRRQFDSLFGLAPLLGKLSVLFEQAITWCMRSWRGWTIRPLVVVAMTAASIFGGIALMPPLDYLPAGNRNLVFGGLLIPPGYSIDQMNQIAQSIEDRIRPYAEVDPANLEAVRKLEPIMRFPQGDAPPPPPFDPVPIDNFFIGSFNGGMFVGATSEWPQVVIPVGQLLTLAMNQIPDAFGGARQSSIFGRGVGGGNSIDIEISGPRLDRVLQAANAAFMSAGPRYGFDKVRPNPSNFNLQEQEWQLRVNNVGRELGVRTTDVGAAARALFDGAFIGDFRYQGETIDFVLLPEGGRLAFKERLLDTPIVTPTGRRVPLDSIVDILPALAPQEIQRIEELESVTIQITPPEGRPLEEVMDEIRSQIIQPLREQGLIDPSMRVRLEGTAAQLDEVRGALFGTPQEVPPSQHRIGLWLAIGIGLIGLIVAGYASFRAVVKRKPLFGYGAAGAALLAVILAGLAYLVFTQPQLGTARFIWALAVTYLLMSALFESYIYPFVIMFSVPLAVVGGFAGLKIVHDRTMADPTIAPQQLDVLTMLGFVILIGVVVNNAILIVHQALNFMRDDDSLDPHAAVARSVRTRIRPIFMSVLTSVGGMLPLVLFPGAGSEMYRGLGSVVIGGLLVSTLFTILLVPFMFSLVMDMRIGLATVLFGKPPPAAPEITPPPTKEEVRNDQPEPNGSGPKKD